MEEKKLKKLEPSTAPSIEAVTAFAKQQKQRADYLENKFRTIDMTTLRLNFLFKVVEFASAFDVVFVSNCIAEIEDILTIEEKPKEKKTEENSETVADESADNVETESENTIEKENTENVEAE